jgi:thiol-disulfide isomerase/thioredoxin
MGSISVILAVVVGGFVALVVGMQVMVRLQARRQTGKDAPRLAGPLGKHIARGRRALVYFYSPGCAACRPVTPKLKELSKKNEGVYVVDVSSDLDTARALKIMATPSFVEIDAGKIVGFHVGQAPAAVLGRYAG